MKSHEETSKADFLRSIARMYYVLGMNQQQIAQKLNIGRSSVARFLAEARDSGIVEIKINGISNSSRELELEDALRSRYKLRDVIVAKHNLLQNFCVVAASYIQSILPYSGIISIGGGTTLHAIGQHLKESAVYNDLQCVQSTGIFSEAVPSTAVVQIWASNLGASPVYLSVPGIVANPEIRKILLQDPMFLQAQQILKNADMCLFGIGTVPQLMEHDQAFSTVRPYEDKIKNNCVGDICFHFYDENGDFCLPEVSDCVFGLSQIDFLRIPVRIAAAIGEEKVPAIRGALTGRLLNVLLTDAPTAQMLLDS